MKVRIENKIINPGQLTDELRAQFPELWGPMAPGGKPEARVIVTETRANNRLGEDPGYTVWVHQPAADAELITVAQILAAVDAHEPIDGYDEPKSIDELTDEVMAMVPTDRTRLMAMAAAKMLREDPDLAAAYRVNPRRRP